MLKEVFGCSGPPLAPDGVWKIGAIDSQVIVDRCPVRELEGCDDVWELLRAGRLADWRLSLTEQDSLPERFIEAWLFASREVAASLEDRLEKQRKQQAT